MIHFVTIYILQQFQLCYLHNLYCVSFHLIQFTLISSRLNASKVSAVHHFQFEFAAYVCLMCILSCHMYCVNVVLFNWHQCKICRCNRMINVKFDLNPPAIRLNLNQITANRKIPLHLSSVPLPLSKLVLSA